VLERLAEARGIALTVVVEGAHRLPPAPGIALVQCADWRLGPGASLRCGLAALPEGATHALVVLADGPELDPRAVERLLAHRDDAEVVAASYDGARSHPVVLARAAWGRVPDTGGRGLEATLVDCSDLRPPGDVDVPREES
jgi:nicotine blue oxidoreductase